MCQKAQNGGGGWREEGVISELGPLALCFIRVEKGGTVNGQEPRQPPSKVNRTARLSSPGLCLFLFPSGSPRKTLACSVRTLCSRLTNGLLIYVLALLLPWNCCHVLCWVGSAVRKSHGCCWVTTECKQFFRACCCRELWSRNLEDCFQRSCFPLPGSQ